MGRKKSLFAISILTVMMLGCGQSLTAQAQQEPAKPVENGQQPKGSEASATVDQQKPKKLNPFTGNADAVTEGRQLYLQSGCPGCHGSGGGGAMAGATPLLGGRWKFGGDDETLFKVIKGTYPGQTMPAVFGAVLKDEQIWKIIAWIRSVYKGDPQEIVW
ncbi:MAG: c-type cytochrome [candidate division NC10 bacterium]|nr:c-type cytochrome [candidate division NC10 bacterium]